MTSAQNKVKPTHLIVRLVIEQLERSLYAYSVSSSGVLLYEGSGYASIVDALMAASGGSDEFLGYEVSYRGVTIGTYRLVTPIEKANSIALDAVETISSLKF
jgi:hypothetical protein